jgi:hypothetical protein
LADADAHFPPADHDLAAGQPAEARGHSHNSEDQHDDQESLVRLTCHSALL